MSGLVKARYLEGTGQAPEGGGVSHGSTLGLGELGLRVNGGGAGVTPSHPCSLEDVKGVLALVEEEPGGASLNGDTKEVVEGPEVLHRKLLLKGGDDALEELGAGGSQDNVIDIEEEIGGLPPWR